MIVIGLLAACHAGAAVQQATRGEAPNLLLITIDTCRADHLGCYGFGLARTPAIDALAADGVRCTNAVTTAPITLPAHSSIMTGLLPPAHGVRDNGGYQLGDAYVTLAEVLKDRGYQTGAFVSAVVLARRYNLTQGFDVYNDDLWAEDEPKLFMIRDRPAPRTADKAVAWLRTWALNAKTPFFLWVHFFDPHQPYESRYKERHLLPTAYDAEIAQADEGVGAIAGFLAEDGLVGSSVVALTADHGESLGEHGEKTHAIFVYDATVQVPLILRYPAALPRGKTYDGPVRCIDIMPTALTLLGAGPAPPIQGIDLLPAFRGDVPPPSLPQYSESLLSEVGFGMAPLYAIRRDGKKWIRAPRPELYELTTDPRELKNQFSQVNDETKSLDTALQGILDDAARYAHGSSRVSLDRETLETLRALGYLAPDKQSAAAPGMDPKDGLALYSKLEDARHAAQRQDYPASERLLREILTAAPNHLTAHNVLGLVLTRMGRYAEAESEYHASLAIDPSQGNVNHLLGVLAVRQGKLDEAAAQCRKALELSPNLVESMVVLGFIAMQQDKQDEAEQWYKRAIVAEPEMPRAQLAYADLFFLRENYREALTYYRNVITATPNHFGATIQAGLCAQRVQAYPEAEKLFLRARDLRPDSWVPVYDLGCLKAEQGEVEAALGFLTAAVEKAPDDARIGDIMAKDPDLKGLHENAALQALVKRARATK